MEIMSKAIEQSNQPYKEHSSYYEYLEEFFKYKKQVLIDGLKGSKLNFRVIEPEGGHFVLVDIKNSIGSLPVAYFFKENTKGFEENKHRRLEKFEDWREVGGDFKPDEAFCNFLTDEYKITPLPCNPFFDEKFFEDKDETVRFVRFAICKKDEDIEELNRILKGDIKRQMDN